MGLSTHPRGARHGARRIHKRRKRTHRAAQTRYYPELQQYVLADPLTFCSDWPVRVGYGLLTLYQGVLLALAADDMTALFTVLIIAGVLLLIDGSLALLRHCTSVNCTRLYPSMRLFQRWRHLLYLPPVFCYLAVLVWLKQSPGGLNWVMGIYYLVLAVLGMGLCIRDGLMSQKAAHEARAIKGRRRAR